MAQQSWLDRVKLNCKNPGPRPAVCAARMDGMPLRRSRSRLGRRDQSTRRCNYPAVAPTHDRVDPPDAGDHVAPCCHSNPIGPFEHRRSTANVKDCPPPNSRWSCLGDRHERPRRPKRAGHRHVRLAGRRSLVRSFRRLRPTRRFGQGLRSKARACCGGLTYTRRCSRVRG